MQCLQLTMDFILSLRHWNPHPEAEPLLPSEDDHYFPPPDTIVTVPRRRPQPLTSNTVRSSTSSLAHEAGRSPSVARVSLERLKRNETISSTFSGRMRPLRTSQPPTPNTAHSRQFPVIQRSTSSTSNPLPKLRLPMPPFPFSTLTTQHSAHEAEREGAKTQPLPTPVLTRPANPVPMARSVSEPQGISDMNQFAAHQIARGRSGGISVDRGRMNRPRAATGSVTAAERLANLSIPLVSGETRRGRSPGPRSAGLGSGRPSPLGLNPRPLLPARAISNDLLNAADVPTDVDQESTDGEIVEPVLAPSQIEVAEEEGVVRRDLGLRGIFPNRRGQRRGRPGRGRATS